MMTTKVPYSGPGRVIYATKEEARLANIEKTKVRYRKNKEKISQQQRERYQRNKETKKIMQQNYFQRQQQQQLFLYQNQVMLLERKPAYQSSETTPRCFILEVVK